MVLAGGAAAAADSLFGEGISYAILSGVTAAQAIGAWADGATDSLVAYDRRLRAVLAPALDRLDAIARAAELSITGALLALRFKGSVRGRAIDAIAGRRDPFRIDGRCDLACACEVHATVRTAPSIPPPAAATVSPHCPRCSTSCAA